MPRTNDTTTRLCQACRQRFPSADFRRNPTTSRRDLRCPSCRQATDDKRRPPPITVDDDFGHWLAGFLDGEGCFTIRPHTLGIFGCEAVLWVRDDDRAIVEEIVARTGIGSVIRRERNGWRDANARPLIGWAIRRKVDCLALVSLLDRYPLRAKKARDYAVWREAVLHWQSAHYARGKAGPGDWSEMAALKQQLEDVRRYR